MKDTKNIQNQMSAIKRHIQELENAIVTQKRQLAEEREKPDPSYAAAIVTGIVIFVIACATAGFNEIVSIVLFVVALVSYLAMKKRTNGEIRERENIIASMEHAIDRYRDDIADDKKKLKALEAELLNPFSDTDLLTMEMTPQNIAYLEKEAVAVFKFKIEHPAFIMLKSWFLRYMPVDFLNASQQQKQNYETCLQKLEASGSWILQVVKRYCDAYAASYTLQIVKGAMGGSRHSVAMESSAVMTKYMGNLRVAQTKAEDDFICLLIQAMDDFEAYVENDDFYVQPEGLDKYCAPLTPEECESARVLVESRISAFLSDIVKAKSTAPLAKYLCATGTHMLYTFKDTLTSVKVNRWFTELINDLTEGYRQGLPPSNVSLPIYLFYHLSQVWKNEYEVFQQMQERLENAIRKNINDYNQSIQDVINSAERKLQEIAQKQRMTPDALEQFRKSPGYAQLIAESKQDTLVMFSKPLAQFGVQNPRAVLNGDVSVTHAAKEMFLHSIPSKTYDDFFALNVVFPNLTPSASDKQFLALFCQFLTLFKMSDKMIDSLLFK